MKTPHPAFARLKLNALRFRRQQSRLTPQPLSDGLRIRPAARAAGVFLALLAALAAFAWANDIHAQVTINCPLPFNGQCASDVPTAATDAASFTAQGGTITGGQPPYSVSVNDFTTPGSCPNRFSINRTYTVTDSTNANDMCSQSITISDTMAPVISGCPANPISLGCNPQNLPTCDTAIALITVSDNCSGPITTNCAAGTPGQTGCSFTQTFTITATDGCNNTSDPCVVTYTWTVDTTPPVISGCPTAPVELPCNPTAPTCANALALISVSDDCPGPITTNCVAGTAVQTGCRFTNTFTLTAVDSCNNTSAPCAVTYSWSVDTTPPTISGCPTGPINLGCNPTFPSCASAKALIQVTDDCAGPITTNCVAGPIVPGTLSVGCNLSQTFTITAVDSCNNTSAPCAITYHWTADTTPPIISGCPTAPIELPCNPTAGQLPSCTTARALITVSDDCPGTIITNCVAGTAVQTGCRFTNTFTLRASDSCNNTSAPCVVTYSWTVDTTRPTLIVPTTGLDLGCATTPPANLPTDASVALQVQSTDVCGAVTTNVTHAAVVTSGCSNSQVFTVTATDACGNTTNKTVTYAWRIDTTPPTFTKVPFNLFLSCNPPAIPDCTSASNPNIIAAADNCGTPVISCNMSNFVSLDGCQHTRTLTFTATDCAGLNTNWVQQIFWTSDTTPPTFTTFPANLNLGCNPGSVPGCNLSSVVAQDLCSTPFVTCSLVDQTNGCGRVRTITYTATDFCGNSAQQSQIITWTNQAAPVFVPPPFASVPQPFSQACGATNDFGCNPATAFLALFDCDANIHATNTCDVPTVTCVKLQTTNCTGTDQGTVITRILTYTARSICATSTCSQVYIWKQTSPPRLVGGIGPQPATTNLGCNPSGTIISLFTCNPGSIHFTNDCVPGEPVVSCVSVLTTNGCIITNTLTYTATNICGQATSTKQVIFWKQDTTPPLLVNCPTPTFVDLGCNPASVPECDANVTALAVCGLTQTRQDLLVASRNANQVLRYNGVSGAFLNIAANSGALGGGLNTPQGVTVGPDGNMYVSSSGNSSVKRYDWTTGTFINTFITLGSGGLTTPVGILLRNSDTNFYVASSGSSAVKQYSGAGGVYLADFVAGSSGGLSLPAGIVFGPDGNLYVSSAGNNSVKRYNGTSGAYISDFVTSGSGGLSSPAGLSFGPDGHLYVASGGDSSVKRYEGTTGASLGNFVAPGDNGLGSPGGLAFGPDNNLYVTSAGDSTVKRYNGTTGVFIDNFVTAGLGGLNGPSYLAFTPALPFIQQVPVTCTQSNTTDTAISCINYRTNTYTAVDICGNVATCQQVFKWKVDTDVPVFTLFPADTNALCNPASIPDCDTSAANVATSDSCPSTITCATTNVVIGCVHYRTNIYTATDLCGNSTTRAQLVTWTIDTDTPVFTKCPTNMNLGCNPQTIPGCDLSPNNVAATDNCSVAITCDSIPDVVDPQNTCLHYRTNTYTAFDLCGHTNTCTQVITWRIDTTNPTITFCPPDTYASCGQADPAHTGTATGADGCGSVTVTYSDSAAAGVCPTNRIITRTWTVTDLCSNSITCNQFITVTNSPAGPAFTNCPANINLGCNPSDTLVATYVCNTNVGADCAVTITCSQAPDQTNGCLRQRTITWSAVDNCNNASSCAQVITWTVDTDAPVFTKCPPTSVNLGCNPAAIPNCDLSPTNVAAIDACSTPVIACSKLDQTNGCVATRRLTYRATDACGNISVCIETITWTIDTNAPVLVNCPAQTLHLGCNPPPNTIPTTNSYAVNAADGCTAFPTLTRSQVDSVVGCLHTRTLTWLATDNCGNSASCQQVIDWTVDTTPPVVTVPTATYLGCNLANPPTDTSVAALVSVTDACGFASTNVSHTAVVVSGCTNTQTFTIGSTDSCGNSATNTVTFTWRTDTDNPTITFCPPDAVVACGQADPSFTGVATGSDGCGTVTVTYSDLTTPGICPTNHFITRTWTVTDLCTNSVTCVQNLTVTNPPTGPVFTNCPANVNLGCNPPDTLVATYVCTNTIGAQADCGLTLSCASVETVNNCIHFRTNTYTAVDSCNNTSTCSYVVTWTLDTDAPTFTKCPVSVNLGCNPATIPDCDLSPTNVAATDNCGTPVITCSKLDQTNGCVATRRLTYKAIDACANIRVCIQTISWTLDTNAPVLVNCPTPVQLHLGCNPNPNSIPTTNSYAVNAADGCTAFPTLTRSQVDSVVGCLHTRTLTWLATDSCGNSASCQQVIDWTVDAPPVFTNCPPSVDLGANPQSIPGCNPNVGATDDCGATPTVNCVTSATATNGCTFYRTNTYTATGGCGLSTVCTQVVTWQLSDPSPTLTVTLSGNNIVICWPVTCATWYFEQATSLSSPITWTRVLTPPVVAGGQNCVTLPYSGNAFFRLCSGPTCP